MEKLHPLSEDEIKVFHSLVSHEDQNKIKKYSSLEINKILQGLSIGLDFDLHKVMFFCKNLNKLTIQHSDLHPRNLMKDSDGNFKLIDFDRTK
jgi:thiamine kinase-like enzyme